MSFKLVGEPREDVAEILRAIAREGLEESRAVDVALDAIESTIAASARRPEPRYTREETLMGIARSQRIEEAEFALEEARKELLRRSGWEQRCDTPGAFYVWVKDFGGDYGRVMAPLDLAVAIERNALNLFGEYPANVDDEE